MYSLYRWQTAACRFDFGMQCIVSLGLICNKWQKNLSLNERDPPDALTTIKAFICTVQHIFSSFLFEVYSMSLI